MHERTDTLPRDLRFLHSIEEFGAALTANGVITLAGSRIYTSMADNDDTIAESLKAFDEVFSNIEI